MLSKQIIAALMLAIAFVGLANRSTKAQTLYGSAGSLQNRENASNVDWAYNWGNTPNNNPFDVNTANYEFVPMIWRATASGVGGQINTILNLEQNFGVHVDYVLGFNEPELSTQSNMTVSQALDVWEVMTDRFSDTDIKLVSPAVSGNGGIEDWLTPFMDAVEARNADANPDNDLQVDAIAYHFYTVAFNPQAEANKLIGQIDDLWETYQRPIWITEFAGTSFSLDNPIHSVAERTAFNRAFIEALIPMFEERDYVERVAWWQFGALGQPYSALSTVSGGVYTPTGIGEVYFRTTLDAGETYDFAAEPLRPTYVHYLKGSHVTNSGPVLPEALRAVDVMEGSSVIGGVSDFGFEYADDAFMRIRSGATLRKQGGNTVTLPGTTVFNEGTMLLEAGTLQLEDGAEMTGDGSLRVDTSGTLATYGFDVDLNSRIIILNRGLLHVKEGLATVTQQLRFWNPSEVRTEGNLVISGETAGAGSILSTGPGTLFLTGVGSQVAGAQVTEGSLVVANEQASPTGPGDVVVDSAGTLGGFGLIDGNLLASGGRVAPGIDQMVTPIDDFEAGVVVNAIDFDFAGVQDDAPLTQTSTLAGGLSLVSGLDFGSGVRPRGGANDGDEFNVAGFRTDSNTGAGSNQGDYLTFTIAPIPGLAVVVEDVSFEFRRNGADSATRYTILSSLDGFSWPDRWATTVLGGGDTATRVLTAANPGSEPIVDEIEFRIVGTDANADSGHTHFYGASVDASFVSDPNGIPLDPTGVLQLGGNYTQLGFATLEIELGGTQPGEFDQLQVDGNVLLSGTLDVSMINGFEASPGQTFDIITANAVVGTFNNVIAPDGLNVEVNYSNTVVSLSVVDDILLGDVNMDGVVNFLDISPFIAVLSSGGFQAEADIDQNGVVNFLDISPFIGLLSQ